MIDIHCHPLPAVDDGAESAEEAAAMCRMAAADGVTHIVATPHCNYTYPFNSESNHRLLAELQAAVGPSPQLLLGCDFHLSYDNLGKLSENRSRFTINGTQYLLVEFDDYFVPEQLDHVFYDLQVADLVPILTHPERNAVFQRRPEIVQRWAARGCLVQITAQSYTGGFGSRARHLAEAWLDQNLVHFFASDAHDTRHRPPLLSPCYRKLAAARGPEMADLIMKKNPRAVIRGEALPPAPPPVEPRREKPRRTWWSIFQRT